MTATFRPWARVERGDLPESVCSGALVVVDEDGRVRASWGDPEAFVFPRSSAKPFQALPLVASGAADDFPLPHVALCCASHSGEPFHIEGVRRVLAAAGADESVLHCGAHYPAHAESSNDLIRRGEEPGRIHNNCSGKHAGMIAACAHRGEDVPTYWRADHPLQRDIRAALAGLGDVPEADIRYAVDGCGVPAWHLPLVAVARAGARVASRRGAAGGWAKAAGRIFEAMAAHPEMVAGTGRFDTVLGEATGRTLLTKGGAEGFQLVAWREADGRGVAMAAKAAAGDPRGGNFAVVETLRRLGVLDADAVAKLARFHAGPVRNHAGEAVGRLVTLFDDGFPS